MGYSKVSKSGTNLPDSKPEDEREQWEEDAPLRGSSSTSSSCEISTIQPAFLGTRTGLRRRLQGRCAPLVLLPWVLNVLLCAGVIYLLNSPSLKNAANTACIYGPEHPAEKYTPAFEAIEYVPVVFKVAVGRDVSPYQGLPTDEKDALWEDLYSKGITIAIDEETNSKLYNKTEKIPIWGLERQHFGGLDVFHQLHCLDMIRMGFYPKRYGTSMILPDGTVDFTQWLHIDHCIESLRESITCHSDVSMNGFFWMDKSKTLEPEMRNVHMCRNFTKIREWAFSRYVDVVSDDKLRSHVEDGLIVDYSSFPELDPNLAIPKDWNLTVDDL